MSHDAIKKQFGKEQIYVVEVDVPRCIHTHGTAPCTATETGNDKCYNTRSTCNDLANYQENITTGSASISVDAANREFFVSSGPNLIFLGFEVGQIITTSGFSNPTNNGQFVIESRTVGGIIVTVESSFGLITESTASGREIFTPNNYTYRYCSPRSPHPTNLRGVAPCVDSVSIAPATISSKGGIGARASASISMTDFKGSDLDDIDPYLSDRTFDPYETGLAMLKWRARNANYENYPARILSGYIVDNNFDEANFETRSYVVSSMSAGNGKAAFKFKDPLQLVSNKKALAPRPSEGVLSAALSQFATSLTLSPSGVGDQDYPLSGYVKVKSEVMSFTRTSGSDTLSIVRGQKNTNATTHNLNDTVQLCLEYTGQSIDKVQADLCSTYAGIPAIYIPRGSWQSEAANLPSNPDGFITDPTPVNKLIGELCDQWPHELFWNDRSGRIEMRALKAPPASANRLDGNNSIMELSTVDRPEMQVSTVFVFYGQFDPTKKIDDNDNYQVTFARPNLDAIARYNSNNTKTIYSRWINPANGAAARNLAQLHGRRFGITPREISFKLDDKDSSAWLGDIREIEYFDIVDSNGNPKPTNFEIISAKEGQAYDYKALEFNYDEFIPKYDSDIGEDTIDLSVDERNISLRTKYESVFGAPNSSTVARFIVYSGVVIGSSSTGSAAIITGSWPSGAEIILEIKSGGYVLGAGGAGSSSAAANGSAGGDAISLGYDLSIENGGIIGGGGGGGGAGSDIGGIIGGGGGGAGDIGGAAGANDTSGQTPTSQIIPTSGGLTTGGGGGSVTILFAGEPFSAGGGNGGALGSVGSNFTDGSSGSSGGAAGKAIDLNGNTLTQTVSGDIRGAIS